MRVLQRAVAAAAVTLVAASSPANATRVLYSYVDKAGGAFNLLASGYLNTTPDTTNVTCYNQFVCVDADYGYDSTRLAFSSRTGTVDFSRQALSTAGVYYSTSFRNAPDVTDKLDERKAMLRVTELADTDVVYAYRSQHGSNFTFVLSGYLSAPSINNYSPVSCVIGNSFACSPIQVSVFDSRLILKTPDPVPQLAIPSGLTAFSGIDFYNQPGVYRSYQYVGISDNGPEPQATLTITGPVAAIVPESSTWAMMIGGFGMIGSAMRRRKVAVSFG